MPTKKHSSSQDLELIMMHDLVCYSVRLSQTATPQQQQPVCLPFGTPLALDEVLLTTTDEAPVAAAQESSVTDILQSHIVAFLEAHLNPREVQDLTGKAGEYAAACMIACSVLVVSLNELLCADHSAIVVSQGLISSHFTQKSLYHSASSVHSSLMSKSCCMHVFQC
jgi:hypothetical protein